MHKKITRRAFCSMLLALPFSARAQQPKKIPRIGFLAGSRDGDSVVKFRRGLRDLGYVEGTNIVIEFRYVEGKLDRIPTLVSELVELNVDVLVVRTLVGIRAAKQATKTIPIVMVTTQDPVATGIVDSLARPGGNITGVTTVARELSGKRLELLKEAVPGISRVAVLWDTNAGPGPVLAFKEYQTAARALKIPLHSLEVRGPNADWQGAFRDAAKGRVSALVATDTLVLSRDLKRVTDLAIKNRLPSMFEKSSGVEAGGLISYSADDAASDRRAAYYVDRILKGTKPADLPVEQPMKFEFVINLKTANQIGLTIPQWTLMKADRVIR